MKKVWALVTQSHGIIDFVDLEETRDGIERIERYTNLFSNPFIVKDVTDLKKVKRDSVFDPETSSFSEFETERSLSGNHHFAFIQDNLVKGIIKLFTEKRYSLWQSAELEGVIAVDCSDMDYSELELGMSWDGTTFTK